MVAGIANGNQALPVWAGRKFRIYLKSGFLNGIYFQQTVVKCTTITPSICNTFTTKLLHEEASCRNEASKIILMFRRCEFVPFLANKSITIDHQQSLLV